MKKMLFPQFVHKKRPRSNQMAKAEIVRDTSENVISLMKSKLRPNDLDGIDSMLTQNIIIRNFNNTLILKMFRVS